MNGPISDPIFGAAAKELFWLDPAAAFLNHGSFGAVPKQVSAAQDEIRREIERQPVDFIGRRLMGELNRARARLAAFLDAGSGTLAFVDNATTGVNAVLRSLALGPDDEILFTDHAYGAIRQTLRYIADRTGARLNEVRIPVPVPNQAAIVKMIGDAITPMTSLAVLDHVTSPTALVLPIGDLVRLCQAHDIPVLVDGAHAPMMIDLEIAGLGADWYTGNCHKWLCAPRGCGFLWAAPERDSDIHPTVISHGYRQGFRAEFDWTGTRDVTAWLAVGAAIDFLERFDLAALRARNHSLAVEAAAMLGARWGTETTGPVDMIGSMATIGLPLAGIDDTAAARALNGRLWRDFGIEVPVIPFDGRAWVRISAHVYNEEADYLRLAEAIESISKGGATT